MKTLPLALVTLATILFGMTANAFDPFPGDRPDLILPAAQDPAPSCRLILPPAHVFLIVTSQAQADEAREAFWAAGMPPGSSLRTFMGPEALERATNAAATQGSVPMFAPNDPSATWARSLLGPGLCR